MGPEITFRDNAVSRTFDAWVDDRIAGSIIYEFSGQRIVISHTIVEPDFRGQGVGTQLVRTALDSVRARGMTVTNYCSFVSQFISTHPAYADLIDPAHPGHNKHE